MIIFENNIFLSQSKVKNASNLNLFKGSYFPLNFYIVIKHVRRYLRFNLI